MNSRHYRLGRRQVAADATRARIVEAAWALIATPEVGVRAFSMEAVAQEAGVARTTVYHQFGTKAALLEAIFDQLAVRGEIAERLGYAFSQRDARDVLHEFVAAFAFFWESDRVVMRRIQAMAVLDPELEAGVHARNLRRREGARAVIGRLRAQNLLGETEEGDETLVDMLYAMTSFGTFHLLAGDGKFGDVAGVVERMAWRAVGRAHVCVNGK
jgi:AcrR family transcriptional regulator